MKLLIWIALFLAGTCSLCSAQPEKIWSTYYGLWRASHGTRVTSTAFDARRGYLYVAGTTYDSSGIATSGSFRAHIQPVFRNNVWQADIFLAKFDTLGNRIWATYYGADSTQDFNPVIVVDANSNIYLAGSTESSSGIASPGGHVPANNFQKRQVFLAKFNDIGQRLWGTYSFSATAATDNVASGPLALAVDRNNNAYIGYATTERQGIATAGTHKTAMAVLDTVDGYIMKFNPDGVKLWGTYYGGERWDGIYSLTTDNDNNVIALGVTRSTSGIATAGTDNVSYNGGIEEVSFVAKFTPSGQRIWGTYVPGNWVSTPIQVLADDRPGKNDIYVTGYTYSDSGVATPGAHQDFLADTSFGLPDIFLVKYSPGGARLWGTYYGGETWEMEFPTQPYNTIAFDNEYNLYMVGTTQSSHYIEKGCTYNAVHHRGFFSKWAPNGHLIWSSYHDTPLYGVAGSGKSKHFYVTGNTPFDSLATPATYLTEKVPGKLSGYIAKFTDASICAPDTIPITLNNGYLLTDTGYVTYQWYKNGVAVPGANSNIYSPVDSGSYYVVVTNICDCLYTSESLLSDPPGTAIIDPAGRQYAACKLYPNPASDRLYIRSASLSGMPYRISDIAGRQIIAGTLHSTDVIDISVLENGIYLFYLSSGQASRFVVNR